MDDLFDHQKTSSLPWSQIVFLKDFFFEKLILKKKKKSAACKFSGGRGWGGKELILLVVFFSSKNQSNLRNYTGGAELYAHAFLRTRRYAVDFFICVRL